MKSRENNLLTKHIDLEEQLGDGDAGNFISGWQCKTPFSDIVIQEISNHQKTIDASKYLYQDLFPDVEEKLVQWHFKRDGIAPQRILISGGSTQLLWLTASWLAINNYSEVFYLSPVYHTLHFALRSLSIRSRPVNSLHVYDRDFGINLPNKTTVLFLTNPVWYAGKQMPSWLIDEVSSWQELTGSLVIVDASFDYMDWTFGSGKSQRKNLDPDKTIRIVCPTKQLATHGYRASYAITPQSIYRALTTISSMLHASLSVGTVALFMAIPRLIDEMEIPHKIVALAKENHKRLRQGGVIEAPWDPDCGYFCFEKTNIDLGQSILMDGGYFDQKRHPGFYRVNLLSPKILLL